MRKIVWAAIWIMVITTAKAQNVGIGTATPVSRLQVTNGAVVFNGTFTTFPANAGTEVLQGAGVRLVWFANKAAFRAGGVDNGQLTNLNLSQGSTYWDIDSLGRFSAAFGYRTRATGMYSFAAGSSSIARGNHAVAMGSGAEANSELAFAIGLGKANGLSSFAQGFTVANGDYAFAIGGFNSANGDYAFAGGSLSAAEGLNSFAMGNKARASGSASAALGNDNMATGASSMAVGTGNTASGNIAFASGSQTTASGESSSTFGVGTHAKAEGGFTTGLYNDNSDAPSNVLQLSTDRIFQIGNGTAGARSNAITVLRNGNIGLGSMFNPVGNIQLPTEVRNRKIVLWANTSNDHQFYGFGINGFTLRYQTPSSSDDHVFFAGSGTSASTELFRIRGNGNAVLAGTLTQNSDATLKKNIEPISNATDLLLQLHGYRYQWKDANADADMQLGLLAQEVQKVLPELVKEGDNGKLGVNYSGLIPVLLEALKEQRSEIDKLKALVKQFIDTRQ